MHGRPEIHVCTCAVTVPCVLASASAHALRMHKGSELTVSPTVPAAPASTTMRFTPRAVSCRLLL